MSADFPAPDGFRLAASDTTRVAGGVPVRVIHPDPGLRLTFAPEREISPGWYQLELAFREEGLVDVVAQFVFADGEMLWLRMPVVARNHVLAHVRLENPLTQLILAVTGSGRLRPDHCGFHRVGMGGQLLAAARRGIDIFRRDGLGVFASGLNYLWRLTRPGSIAVSRGSAATKGEAPYETWIRLFDELPDRDAARHAERLASLAQRPLISILANITVASDLPEPFVDALIGQIYPFWEFVLAAPPQHHGEIASSLAERGLDCAKLRIVDSREGLNATLVVARGAFVLPLKATTLLRPHALLEFALTVARVPEAQLVYADEDTIGNAGQRSNWRFKPAWSPNWFAGMDYLGSATLIRRAELAEAGGWHGEDALSLLTEKIEPRSIVHLAKILAHTTEAAQPGTRGNAHRTLPLPPPRVSLIIPTRDGAAVLATCIRSIRALTRYPDYEIIVIDNGSVEDATKRLFAEFAADPAIRILARPESFNFSRLNNGAVREATGSVLGFVNNDIEVTKGDWLDELVTLAVSPQTGCVGGKLLYPDGRIQHAGVVVGLRGVAGHAYRFAQADEPGYLNRLTSTHEVSAVTAACLVIRREVFDAVGGFDEGLAVAFNDVDFCLKVRAAGYLNLWTPFAELIHHESVSRGRDLTPAKAKRFADEHATMQRRWGAQLLQDPYYSPHLTYDREDYSPRLR